GVVNGLHRLLSPTLYDPTPLIGRSSVVAHGSNQDTGGTPVGSPGTIVSDGSFAIQPPGFSATAAGTPQIHTEIGRMNMVGGLGNAVAVRAGTMAPDQPVSPGEIVAVHSSAGLFPGNSFFNVYVEVTAPILGTLYNSDPLMVENDNIACFPPTVVY